MIDDNTIITDVRTSRVNIILKLIGMEPMRIIHMNDEQCAEMENRIQNYEGDIVKDLAPLGIFPYIPEEDLVPLTLYKLLRRETLPDEEECPEEPVKLNRLPAVLNHWRPDARQEIITLTTANPNSSEQIPYLELYRELRHNWKTSQPSTDRSNLVREDADDTYEKRAEVRWEPKVTKHRNPKHTPPGEFTYGLSIDNFREVHDVRVERERGESDE